MRTCLLSMNLMSLKQLLLLQSGEVDVNEPYGWEEGDEVAEGSQPVKGDLVLERWRKLAGLLNS